MEIFIVDLALVRFGEFAFSVFWADFGVALVPGGVDGFWEVKSFDLGGDKFDDEFFVFFWKSWLVKFIYDWDSANVWILGDFL